MRGGAGRDADVQGEVDGAGEGVEVCCCEGRGTGVVEGVQDYGGLRGETAVRADVVEGVWVVFSLGEVEVAGEGAGAVEAERLGKSECEIGL